MTTLRETVSVVASEVQYEPRYSTWGAGRKITVLVAYSDESGQDEGPIAVVTAALLNIDSQWPPLAAELEVIEPVRHREIKGQALFKDLRNGRQCKRADSTLLKIISAVCDNRLPIFSGAVRRDWLAKDEIRRSKISDKVAKTTPYEMAFALCLHRIDMYVHTIFPSEQVVWIADSAKQYERKITTALAVWRQNAQSKLPLHQIFPQGLHIADTIYFGDSQTSRALQVADVCCSIIRERLLKNPIATKYFDLIRPQLQNDITPYPDGPAY